VSTAAGPTAQVAIGLVLRESVAIVLRHWWILLISMVALAEGTLVVMGFLSRCFSSFDPACSSSWTTMGVLPQWLFKSALDYALAFVVSAVAFYFLYSSRRIDMADVPRLRNAVDRGLWFFGRVALSWILMLTPIWLIDLGFARMSEHVAMTGMTQTMRWIVFLLRTTIAAVFLAYLHARLVFYLPSVAFHARPLSLSACWRRSRDMNGYLFAPFFVISVAVSAAQIALLFLMNRSGLYLAAVDLVSNLLAIRSDFVVRNLSQSAAYVLVGMPGTLTAAAVSLVVFKTTMSAAERSTADIFD